MVPTDRQKNRGRCVRRQRQKPGRYLKHGGPKQASEMHRLEKGRRPRREWPPGPGLPPTMSPLNRHVVSAKEREHLRVGEGVLQGRGQSPLWMSPVPVPPTTPGRSRPAAANPGLVMCVPAPGRCHLLSSVFRYTGLRACLKKRSSGRDMSWLLVTDAGRV